MATWWNDYKNNVLQGHSIFTSAVLNATTLNGAAVDMKESQEGLHAQLHTGTINASTTIDVTLEESEDGSTGWTAITDFITGQPAAFAQIVAADDNVNRTLNFKRSKRFVRAVALAAGGTGGFLAVSIHGMRRRVL